MRTCALALALLGCPLAAAAAPGGADPDSLRPSHLEKPPPLERSAGPDDPEPPRGDRGYDVLHYDLDLKFDLAGAAVSGTVGVRLRAIARPLARVRLDLVEALGVRGITWAADEGGSGVPIDLPWTRGGDSLAVELPEPLPAGAAGRLAVTYGGRPPPHGAFNAGLMFREYEGSPVVANMSEPWSAHSWWPCKDVPDDKATVRLAASVPDTLPWRLQVVGNGTLVDESVPERGWRRFAWREDYPIATYLVSVAIGDYVAWGEECHASTMVPLHAFVFPAKEEAARRDLAPTCEMLRFMEGIAGPWPFPGEKYGQATIVWGGAMEHQTATSLGAFLLTGDGRYQNIILHELAHQWYGDSVGPARWRDIWLNEGFATYCETLWSEHRGGRAAYLDHLQRIGPRRHADLFAGDGTLADPAPILPNSLVYDKGAWVLHMLRGLLGDGPFFSLLRSWSDDPARRHGTVTTEDFVAHVAAAAGAPAAEFLSPWLWTEAVPVLRWRWQAAPAAGGGTRVRLELEQLQAPPFLLPVPVHLHGPGGARIERALLRGGRETFSWTVPGAVDSLSVDPEGWLLWRRAPAAAPRLRVVAVRPNPVGPDGALVEFALAAPARLAVRLHDARGRRLGAWDLGPVEPAAAGEPPHAWRLQASDAGGRPLPAGAYWLELLAGDGGRAVTRLTVVR